MASKGVYKKGRLVGVEDEERGVSREPTSQEKILNQPITISRGGGSSSNAQPTPTPTPTQTQTPIQSEAQKRKEEVQARRDAEYYLRSLTPAQRKEVIKQSVDYQKNLRRGGVVSIQETGKTIYVRDTTQTNVLKNTTQYKDIKNIFTGKIYTAEQQKIDIEKSRKSDEKTREKVYSVGGKILNRVQDLEVRSGLRKESERYDPSKSVNIGEKYLTPVVSVAYNIGSTTLPATIRTKAEVVKPAVLQTISGVSIVPREALTETIITSALPIPQGTTSTIIMTRSRSASGKVSDIRYASTIGYADTGKSISKLQSIGYQTKIQDLGKTRVYLTTGYGRKLSTPYTIPKSAMTSENFGGVDIGIIRYTSAKQSKGISIGFSFNPASRFSNAKPYLSLSKSTLKGRTINTEMNIISPRSKVTLNDITRLKSPSTLKGVQADINRQQLLRDKFQVYDIGGKSFKITGTRGQVSLVRPPKQTFNTPPSLVPNQLSSISGSRFLTRVESPPQFRPVINVDFENISPKYKYNISSANISTQSESLKSSSKTRLKFGQTPTTKISIIPREETQYKVSTRLTNPLIQESTSGRVRPRVPITFIPKTDEGRIKRFSLSLPKQSSSSNLNRYSVAVKTKTGFKNIGTTSSLGGAYSIGTGRVRKTRETTFKISSVNFGTKQGFKTPKGFKSLGGGVYKEKINLGGIRI